MGSVRYVYRHGSYYLMEDVGMSPLLEERIVLMSEHISIGYSYDGENAVLHKHGTPDQVRDWAERCYERLPVWMANEIRILDLPKDFPADEINRFLSTTGHLTAYVKRHGIR